MILNFKDEDTYMTISSDLLYDRITIDISDDYGACIIFINRKDSLGLSNKIIEFWSKNPKISF